VRSAMGFSSANMALVQVFCKRCFENRKPTKKVKVGFVQDGKKVICAVDGCESDVAPKAAWVGLFM
jgi:hypothetical protein